MRDLWCAFWMCFGMFCAIPCPVKIWREELRPRMVACLPLLGGVLGGLLALALWLLRLLSVPGPVAAAIMTMLPWLLTGFLHLDGYMDCCDAILSRRDLETRQKILKDSHVGSFAVICFGLLLLGSFALWSTENRASLLALACVPVASRACAAMAVTCLSPMGHSQYAGAFAREKGKGMLALPLLALAAAVALPILTHGVKGLAPLAAAVGYWLAAGYARRQLGGMSGDVSGFALTIGELCGAAVLTLL